MYSHQAFPQLAMIGYGEMEQLMDDDVVPEILIESQKINIEVQVAIKPCAPRRR